MKKLLSLLLFLPLSILAQDNSEQPKAWSKGVTTSLNFSQVAFSNWAAGGVNSVAFNGFINAHLNYDEDIYHWENLLKLEYGVVKTGDEDYLKKSNDKIDFISKYGINFSNKFRLTGELSFLSQFSDGFDYAKVNDDGSFKHVSGFLAPAYLQFGVGIDFVPSKCFSVNVAPAMAKFTIVTVEELQVKYGNDSLQVCKPRFGGQVSASFNKEIIKNVTLQTSVRTFFDYLDKEGYKPVVNWDLAVVMKINKFMSANIGTNLIWDKDVMTIDTNDDGVDDKAGIQFKELVGVGFTFSF